MQIRRATKHALLDHTHGVLQDMTNRLHGLGKKVGLRISDGKTKTMTVGKQHVMPPITLDNQNIENVHKFQYLGSYMAEDGDVEVDIRTRIGKASSVFQRLQPIYSKHIKLQLYSSIVVPTATYACETWKTTARATKMIDVFQHHCLRRILGISWRDHITNDEAMTRSGQKALHDIVATRRRRFIKHILRLPPARLASLAIEWRPEDGNRNIGRPKRTWQDTLKKIWR